ncbi:flavodoxin [Dyadobacter sp. UC 10]|nr:flavodoxin [Dyadobacter sp. UC 10]
MSCTSGEQPRVGDELPSDGASKKILIVYLSRTNNTKAVAEMIQAQMGGKLVALELANPYPADYRTTVDQVAQENASGFLPPLATKIDSIDQYDLIFLGFPTWGMQLPPPIKSFLAQYNLAGKTIAPFNTNAGYGIGSTFEQVKTLASRSVVLEGFSTRGGIERDGVLFVMEGGREVKVRGEVAAWLGKLRVK